MGGGGWGKGPDWEERLKASGDGREGLWIRPGCGLGPKGRWRGKQGKMGLARFVLVNRRSNFEVGKYWNLGTRTH